MLDFVYMTWFLYALGAPILWSLVNIADQYLVNKHAKGEHPVGALVLFSSLVGIVVAFIIALFARGIFEVSTHDRLILILSGFFSLAWIVLYLKALEIEDVSSVVPWFLTIPVFGYIFGYIFLGETLTKIQMIGSSVVLFGGLILSLEFSEENRVRFKGKVALMMIASCIFAALWGVLFKFVTSEGGFWVSSFWEYIGLGLAGLLIWIFVKSYRNAFTHMVKTGGRKILTLNISSEAVTMFGNFCQNFALLLAPVTLVFLVATYQPIIVLALTFICTKFFPWIVEEKFNLRHIAPKLVAMAVMIIGSMLLF